MKTYTIHLLRHALTRGNLEGRYIGQTDEPLCREGREQLLKMKNETLITHITHKTKLKL